MADTVGVPADTEASSTGATLRNNSKNATQINDVTADVVATPNSNSNSSPQTDPTNRNLANRNQTLTTPLSPQRKLFIFFTVGAIIILFLLGIPFAAWPWLFDGITFSFLLAWLYYNYKKSKREPQPKHGMMIRVPNCVHLFMYKLSLGKSLENCLYIIYHG